MEDTQIIDLFFARDSQAIHYLKEKYNALCLHVARHILPDERDIEECLNDTCLKVWNTIPPKRPDSLAAYLSRIIRNLALDRYNYNHAEKRSTALTDAFDELEAGLSSSFSLEQLAEADDFRQIINRFLAKQPAQGRIYFVRRYWYGDSIAEIANAFQVSEEKVKSSLFRTRNRLKNTLEKEGIVYE